MSSVVMPQQLPGSSVLGGMANERVDMDTPPFSRVFVVCSKHHREDELRAAFQDFGNIEDVWMVKV